MFCTALMRNQLKVPPITNSRHTLIGKGFLCDPFPFSSVCFVILRLSRKVTNAEWKVLTEDRERTGHEGCWLLCGVLPLAATSA